MSLDPAGMLFRLVSLLSSDLSQVLLFSQGVFCYPTERRDPGMRRGIRLKANAKSKSAAAESAALFITRVFLF
jgi:hypothetical protein